MKLVSVVLVAVAAILAAAAPSGARPHHGGHDSGHHGGGHHDGHRDFHRDHHGHVIVGGPFFFGPAYPSFYAYAPPPVVVEPPPVYVQPPPQSYWYFCPSVGAYYPTVPSCPEPWVPVPAL